MAVDIADIYRDKNPVFLGILKGSFIFMADLIRACNIRSEVEFVQCATYHGFDRSDDIEITSFFDINKLKGRHVIIAEDIVDSGQTVGALAKELERIECASLYLATLLYKPEAFTGARDPDLIGFSITNDFVIGYGLDYDGQARELRDIYVKCE
ncbi:UNVERIFIED_CONTAM: hypothetical protein GTU68_015666 [Idotea baltica]|nr:hypothetical protein [Idotea baltica]